jgi:hypothetical protein
MKLNTNIRETLQDILIGEDYFRQYHKIIERKENIDKLDCIELKVLCTANL